MPETDVTADRVARNEAIFRDSNETISGAAREYAVEGPVPFICECAEPACTAIVRVSVHEYERVRGHPARFLTAPGHYVAAEGYGDVVERGDGYEVVEKTGEAAATAEELDSRSP